MGNAKKNKSNEASEMKKKNRKTFVDQKDVALQLARAIADVQEEKAHQKVGRYHKNETLPKADKKTKTSSKNKLKEIKATIKAGQTKAKKDRVKARRQASKPENEIVAHDAGTSSFKPPRKSVSFA